jgi:hypothetical protein
LEPRPKRPELEEEERPKERPDGNETERPGTGSNDGPDERPDEKDREISDTTEPTPSATDGMRIDRQKI